MLSCCLKCREKAECKNPKVVRAKNEGIVVLSNCVVYNCKKSKFIKEQEASGLLSSLRIKRALNRIPLLGPLLF